MNFNCNNKQNCCSNTCHCQPEPCCCIGPTGPAGPQGPPGSQGATGPTGPAGGFEPAYGTFINTEFGVISQNTLVPLNAVLSVPPVGITFTPGSTTVTVLNAGTYRITYQLVANSVTSFTLIINGVVLTSGIIYSAGNFTSTTGTATVALSANSSLGIISIGSSVLPYIQNALNVILDVVRIS